MLLTGGGPEPHFGGGLPTLPTPPTGAASIHQFSGVTNGDGRPFRYAGRAQELSTFVA